MSRDWILPAYVLAVAILLGSRLLFRPGLRRAVATGILAGLSMPTVVAGDGIGILPAVFLLFDPGENPTGFLKGILSGVVPILIGGLVAFGATLPGTSADTAPDDDGVDSSGRPSVRQERQLLAVLIVIAIVCVPGMMGYRWFQESFLETYGPVDLRVDIPGMTLHDIAVELSCSVSDQSREGIHAKRVVTSGAVYRIPVQYLGERPTTLVCRILLAHPQIQTSLEQRLVVNNARSRQVISLDLVAPPWSALTMKRDVVTSSRSFYEDAGDLQIHWIPFFCDGSLDRIKQEYLPLLLERKASFVPAGQPGQSDAEFSAGTVKAWDGTCDYVRSNPWLHSD